MHLVLRLVPMHGNYYLVIYTIKSISFGMIVPLILKNILVPFSIFFKKYAFSVITDLKVSLEFRVLY